MDKLRTVRRGPRREFLPSLPNANGTPVPGVVGGVQALTKALVLNHSLGLGLAMCVAAITFGNQLQPLFTSPPVAVPPTLFAQPVRVELELFWLTTVKGFPLWVISVPASLHPPTASLSAELLFR